MKIIIVPNEPNPNMTGRHYGIAKALASRGHEVHTIMWDLPHQMKRRNLLRHSFTSLRTAESRYEDLTLHKIGRLPFFWPYLNGWLFRRQITKLYRRLDADIIFAQSYTNETTIPKNLPFIYDLADDYAAPADVYGSPIYKLAFKVLGVRKTMRRHCRDALAVTAVSEILTTFAKQYNANVTKLPNGIETDIINKVLSQPTTKKIQAHSMIYVSGFGPWSQPIKVMQAALDLRKLFPDLSLTMVGEGSEVNAIKSFIAEHDSGEFIQYRGFVHDRAKVFELINQHAIGLSISEKNKWRDAAHPMKVIEYSALGKKVVSTNLLGVQALNLPNIFIFSDDQDGSGLKIAMTDALNTTVKFYPEVSKQIRLEYSWNTIMDSLVSIMQSVTGTTALPRVIHVTPSYPPALGGLEKVVQVLATTQSETGLQVSVLTAKNSQVEPAADSVPVRRLPCFVVANTTIIPRLLTSLLQVSESTVIHLHITQAWTPEMVYIASRLRRFRYVAHIHLDVPPSGIAGFLLKVYKPVFLRRVLHGASYVIVFTKDQRTEVCKKYGLDQAKVAIIPNGAEDSYFYNKARKLHAKPRLLYVGRLGFQKNLPQLLHALVGISDKLETTLVGDGELQKDLQILAKQLKLTNITFAGRAEDKTLRAYYERSDVFVLPSEREGMPLVLLEAMAMGLPIVATDVIGSRDVVHNDHNGLLVPYGNIVALRKALVRVTSDSSLYGRLHVASRSMADNYTWLRTADKFLKLYRQAL